MIPGDEELLNRYKAVIYRRLMKCVHILALKNFLIEFQNYKESFYKIIGKITLNYYLIVHSFYDLIYT